MDAKVKRDIILDSYQNPSNRGLIEDDTYIRINTKSSSCVDNIDVMAKVVDGKIADAKFDGEACAICTSATAIMLRTLIGKNLEEASVIIDNFERMINEDPYDDEVLEELNVYDETYKQPSRKRCALLPAESVRKIIDKAKKEK